MVRLPVGRVVVGDFDYNTSKTILGLVLVINFNSSFLKSKYPLSLSVVLEEPVLNLKVRRLWG